MSIDWKVWQRPDVAGRFADRRRSGVLGGAEQLQTLVRLVAATGCEAPVLLDLGCGDGVLMETLCTAFPGARGVALDGSPAMLGRARTNLAGASVTLVEADFNDPDWVQRLPENTFDAIVSGFAIHHSEDERKQRLYAELFALLRPGGVFVNVEHVASASPLGETFFEDAWVENLASITGQPIETLREELRHRPDRDANRLTPVETQLTWLREIGFVDVDCYWKHFELAVLAGYRPHTLRPHGGRDSGKD